MKTNGSPATGAVSGEKVLREKVKTKSAAPGAETRAASRSACRNSVAERARFQMPWAMTKSQLPSGSGIRSMPESARWSPGSDPPVRRCAARQRSQHRQRVVEADDVPAQVCQRNRIACCAAAQVERPRPACCGIGEAKQLTFGEPNQDLVRCGARETGHDRRGAPGRVGAGGHAGNVACRRRSEPGSLPGSSFGNHEKETDVHYQADSSGRAGAIASTTSSPPPSMGSRVAFWHAPAAATSRCSLSTPGRGSRSTRRRSRPW